MRPLRVIAGAVLDGGRLLLVSKHAAPDVYFLPGGKPEAGEPPLRCLRRLAPAVRDHVIPRLRRAGRL